MSSAPPSDLLRDDERTTSLVRRGPWTIELRSGELENIRHNGLLVLRSVRPVVRDENWRTVPFAVDAITGVDSSGELVVEASTRDEHVSLSGRLVVSGDGDELTITYRARAQGDFLRNRLGLIVLHPPELAETAFDVRHADGSATHTAFPGPIAPHQPARDISGLDWTIGAEHTTECRLDFFGDVFEMEDQRNWTDASYKTYSTPLSRPFPVPVHNGDTVEQSVVLRCVPASDAVAVHDGPADSVPELVIGRIVPDTLVPALTTTASTAPSSPAAAGSRPVAAWAKALLIEIDPLSTNWRAAFDRAVADADGRPLDVRIVAEGVEQAGPVLDALAEHPSSAFARVGLFARTNHIADPDEARSLIGALDRRGLDVQVIAGTRAHFTELNRAIERLDQWRGPITFSITPFMHDTAGHQLVESIAMQREVARNAGRLAGDRPLHIGPITVGARFNAVATTPAPASSREDLEEGYGAALVPGATDSRTDAASLAAWLLASVAALAAPKVLTLSYLEEGGPRSASHESAVTVLSWLAELEGRPLRSASATGFAVLAAGGDDTAVVLVGNLDAKPRAVRLPGSTVPIVIAPGQVRRFAGLAAPPRG
jgi:hypothetical protein